jgi:glucokinase
LRQAAHEGIEMAKSPGLIIGVDLGGTKMHVAAVDEAGELLAQARGKTHPEEGADAVIGRLADLVRDVAAQRGAALADIAAISLGVPGEVNEDSGVVDTAPNLGWVDVPLAQSLSSSLGLDGARTRIFLDNDVRVATLGEHAYGVGKGSRTMVGLFVGTGIGGGIIIDGKPHRGGRGSAGELGHMCLAPDGPRCSCGHRGCAEALASRTAMERDVRAALKRGHKSKLKLGKKQRLTSSAIAKALDDGDKVMHKVWGRALKQLGLLVGNLVNALDPEVVVIGGGLAERLGEEMVRPIREVAYERFLLERDRERVHIEATQLKDAGAPLGAAYLARQKLAATEPAAIAHARTGSSAIHASS